MKYTPQDFKSDQEVKWCPGCGDHAVLASIQRALPEISEELGYSKERYVFVSGIGCSSRFPYYMKTYGFHGIHGRAAAIATGMKVANPTLSIWEMTGDGDSLAIGGNHLIHAIRRNVDINIVLFNNRIYGLTKGQYSPTSKWGSITRTSPYGTVEHRSIPALWPWVHAALFCPDPGYGIETHERYHGRSRPPRRYISGGSTSKLCIFNDKTHAVITDRAFRADRTIVLRHGEPMVYGKDNDKGLVLTDSG